MLRRFVFSYLSTLVLGVLCAWATLFCWCKRHGALVFFGQKFHMAARFCFISLIFTSIFIALHFFYRLLVNELPLKRKRYHLLLDFLSSVFLPVALLHRATIDSREQGNYFFLCLFLFWGSLKGLLFFQVFIELTQEHIKAIQLTLKKNYQKALGVFKIKTSLDLYFLVTSTFAFLILEGLKVHSLSKMSWLFVYEQTLWVLSAMLVLYVLIQHLFPKQGSFYFQSFIFFLLALALLDYLCLQLVNVHMKSALTSLLEEGFTQVLQTLEGADVNPYSFFFVSFLVIFLPFVAAKLLKALPPKKIKLRSFFPLIFLGLTSAQMFYTESKLNKLLSFSETHTIKENFSPFAWFIEPKGYPILTENKLKEPPRILDATHPSRLKRSPPIFLIVIESLRADLIDSSTAPFMQSLKEKYSPFLFTASNCNVTHASLFSIYQGLYPHHWKKVRDNQKSSGSYALKALKESGYQLHAFHSSYFRYFNIGECLFGKNYKLLNSCFEAKHHHHDVAQRDRLALSKLETFLENTSFDEPQFVTLLLDSTHHHYYWSEDFDPPFKPYIQGFNYASRSKEQLKLTLSRYKNSIRYVDTLLTRLCNKLKEKGLYDEALIIITGDHAEEFMEYGHYFHGTDLCFVQSLVPIIYKLPHKSPLKIQKEITSHIDILPSLFDYLGLDTQSLNLPGQSVFQRNANFVISFKPDPKSHPHQFYFFDGEHKLEMDFNKPSQIYESTGFEIQALKDKKETLLPLDPSLFQSPLIQRKIQLIKQELFDN